MLLFKNLGSVSNIAEYNIELNTSISVDQRRYNGPGMDQVAGIWMDGNDPQQRFSRSIIIYGSEDRPHYIRAYHGCYDPLAYPFLTLVVRVDGRIKRLNIRIHLLLSRRENIRSVRIKVCLVFSNF